MSSTDLSTDGINTVSWVMGSVAIALTTGRYLIRWKGMGGFRADDWAHLAATVFLIADLSLFTAQIPSLNQLLAFEMGTTDQMPSFYPLQAASVADSVLLFSCLWSVKLAFLFFYRSLFKVSKGFKFAWWSALTFNIATYWVCFAGAFVQCGGAAKYLFDMDACNSDESLMLDRNIFIFSSVMIISSDIVTMILPLAMLNQLQMRTSQKLAIGGIFCLSLLSIAFEALRLGKSLNGITDLNALWIHLEEAVAVIVSALPTYYALVNWRRERTSQRYYDSYGSGAQRLKSTSTSGSPYKSADRSTIDRSSIVHHAGQFDPLEAEKRAPGDWV